MGYRVAVVGATGNVGREMLNILEEVNFPVEKIHAIASRNSIGLEVEFGDRILKCEDIAQFDFSTVDLVLMSVSGAFSKEWAPKIGAAGAIVIDNSSAWRMDPDVPLVVPEVNPDDVEWADRKNIIANPNCSTIQLVVALKPLHDAARIKRVVVSTYQSVSGAGKAGMDDFDQTKNVYVLGATPPKLFPKQIAFNVIPYIGTFQDDGYTDEEHKMWNETHKMLDPDIALTVTCVRTPVMVGHSEAVNIEFHEHLDEDDARDILRESPGVIVIDKREPTGYITPKEAQGEFGVFVSRIRNDPTVEHGLNLWVVSDNLRKGAALNAVQIAELLHQRGLIRQKALAYMPIDVRAEGGEARLALTAGIGCYLIWGFVPLAFQVMDRLGVGSWEILAHRTLWAAPTALILVLAARQGRKLMAVFGNPKVLAWLGLSSVLIAANWAIYINAVNSGRVLEGSFGYYITPLINMASGALIFRERIDRIGAISIALAAVGVAFQGFALGHLPLIALALALSFGGYGIVRKQVQADAQTGLFVECLLLSVPGALYLAWLGRQGAGHFTDSSATMFWLMAAGPITALPLALFSWCARRLPMSAMAFLQFIGPTIGFGIGIAQDEPFTALHAVSFAFIWSGAAVFAWGAWRRSRAVLRATRDIAAAAE